MHFMPPTGIRRGGCHAFGVELHENFDGVTDGDDSASRCLFLAAQNALSSESLR